MDNEPTCATPSVLENAFNNNKQHLNTLEEVISELDKRTKGIRELPMEEKDCCEAKPKQQKPSVISEIDDSSERIGNAISRIEQILKELVL